MKVIFFLLLASSHCLSYPVIKTWTFHELTHAVEKMDPFNPNVDPDNKSLFDAFDIIMAALFSGEDDYVQALMLSPTGSKTWTMGQLEAAINDTNTNPNLLPFIAQAHHGLTEFNSRKDTIKTDKTQVLVPALDISKWTHEDVTTALKDPKTKPPMLSHLKTAQKHFNDTLETGEKKETVSIITPVGLILQEGIKPLFVPKKTLNETYIIPKHAECTK